MLVVVHGAKGKYEAIIDQSKSIELCQPVDPHSEKEKQIGAFEIPPPQAEGWLDVRKGATVNCYQVALCAHGNGTHTECVGHITKERVFVTSCQVPQFLPSLVVTVKPMNKGDDLVITRQAVEEVVAGHHWDEFIQGLVVRCIHSTDQADYSNTNPPYFSNQAMLYIRDVLNIRHLLVNLPSVDREKSDPSMPCHSIFFGITPGSQSSPECNQRSQCTITELISFPSRGCVDGLYLLSLQVAPIKMDASPSRPVLYPLKRHITVDRSISLCIVGCLFAVAFVGLYSRHK
mmetsp:Transcript_8900/g.14469  ORF Transcript_8900/g.14469 Transcript_8900/m.14469 type:complete len:289 (+) Transcript_8900:88-954(+)